MTKRGRAMSVAMEGITVKEIDVEQIRSAIIYLDGMGRKEAAREVWTLLDNYISQPAQPLVMKSYMTTSALEDALAGGFGPQDRVYVDKVLAKARTEQASRGASAWNGLPGCTVSAYHAAAQACPRKATGHLVRVNEDKLDGHNAGVSFPVCNEHGEMFNRPGHTDWVQAFFGDENSAADVAELAAKMAD